MREVKHYICDVCGMEHISKENAKKCEKSHLIPKLIIKGKYICEGDYMKGYPTTIMVLMSDGAIVTYEMSDKEGKE